MNPEYNSNIKLFGIYLEEAGCYEFMNYLN